MTPPLLLPPSSRTSRLASLPLRWPLSSRYSLVQSLLAPSSSERGMIKPLYMMSKGHLLCSVDRLKINAPSLNLTPLSESTPGYMTMAFPTLFPNSTGDFNQPRLRKVDGGPRRVFQTFFWRSFHSTQEISLVCFV
jgi:hypothetical protein